MGRVVALWTAPITHRTCHGTAKADSLMRHGGHTSDTHTAQESALQLAGARTMIVELGARHFASTVHAADGKFVQQLMKEQHSDIMHLLAALRFRTTILVLLCAQAATDVSFGTLCRIEDRQLRLRT
jgi:hypothetical protein